ncbi:hypothetical protein CBER1_09288 [Cercospora berteroae]|uniref:Uncharacterized protein n=1 Tax=Cercospora berteroae TaxID=357750 RepID=A0A2S6CFB3_9PEZI|nr:hypothetical protein CBER1_09288 [Cercospora berteroae]
MSSRRDRERDVLELAQLRIENEALRGQYQMVQDELVRTNAWASHYQAESEQKDGEMNQLREQKDAEINELKQKMMELEKKNMELQMAAVNINK